MQRNKERISLSEGYELQVIPQDFNGSLSELRNAVKEVRNKSKDVETFLAMTQISLTNDYD